MAESTRSSISPARPVPLSRVCAIDLARELACHRSQPAGAILHALSYPLRRHHLHFPSCPRENGCGTGKRRQAFTLSDTHQHKHLRQDGYRRIEVITGQRRRRQWSDEEKATDRVRPYQEPSVSGTPALELESCARRSGSRPADGGLNRPSVSLANQVVRFM